MAGLLTLSLFTVLLFATSQALVCYESSRARTVSHRSLKLDFHAITSKKGGENWKVFDFLQGSAVPRNSSSYRFCVMLHEQGSNAALFGVSRREDATEVYQEVVDLSNNYYRILTMCILEVHKP